MCPYECTCVLTRIMHRWVFLPGRALKIELNSIKCLVKRSCNFHTDFYQFINLQANKIDQVFLKGDTSACTRAESLSPGKDSAAASTAQPPVLQASLSSAWLHPLDAAAFATDTPEQRLLWHSEPRLQPVASVPYAASPLRCQKLPGQWISPLSACCCCSMTAGDVWKLRKSLLIF